VGLDSAEEEGELKGGFGWDTEEVLLVDSVEEGGDEDEEAGGGGGSVA
jgi:hypothetical protein